MNIKPGRVGGVDRGDSGCTTHASTGATPVLVGGMLETGVGRAVNVALASLPGFTEPGDLSASDRYFAEDVTEPFLLEDGRCPSPTVPASAYARRRDPAPAHRCA